MLTVIYVVAAFVALLPWSYIVKFYGMRIGLKGILKETSKVKNELSKVPESKPKKKRILTERYRELRGKVSRFIMLNLILLWVGVIGSLIFARLVTVVTANLLGVYPYIPSPLLLPYVSVNGALNDLILYLAALLAYLPLHNRITGIKALHEIR